MNRSLVKRLVGIAILLFFLFSVLIVRFYILQIVEHEKWTREALAQHQYVVSIPSMRGSFYSNTSIKKGHPEENQPFVIDVPKFHLFIDPQSIPSKSKEKVAQQIAQLAGSYLTHKGNISAEFYKKSRSRKVAAWLDRDVRKQVEDWWKLFAKEEKIALNAIFFVPEYKRSYPFGALLGAVLQTVRDERDAKDQQPIPTGGLEMMFHSYLKGKPGKKQLTRSSRHLLDVGTILEPPENGANVYLTVNHYLQAIAETELCKGVESAKAKGGWAVMMDPYNGEILVLAQYPPFDPTRYADYFNDPSLQDAMRIRAVSDCYEPGSIFKPITLAICLKANEELLKLGKEPIFTPEEKIPTANGWFPGRSKPLKDTRLHQFLNMDLAVQKSSNIYMARLVHRLIQTMGDEWYRRALFEVFGFGTRTNIELSAENQGLLPSVGKMHPNKTLEWSLPTPYSLAIGHNILVNAIQMVRAYAIFANGGKAVQPHLVRKIVKTNHNGEQVVLAEHQESEEMVLSSSICSLMIRSMKFVTKEGGSSKRADIMGYTEAGKSGTAEKVIDGKYSKECNISSFLGLAPANAPRFVLLVSLDEPEKKFIPGVGRHQFGGVCAAPIFREIAAQALQYLGVTPDDPYGYPIGDPRRDLTKADWVEEVRNLKTLYEQWNL